MLKNCLHHLLHATFLQEVNVKKSEKIAKIAKIDEEIIFISSERHNEFQWHFQEKCHL